MRFPTGILWLRLSGEADAVAVAFSISEYKVSYRDTPFFIPAIYETVFPEGKWRDTLGRRGLPE